MSTMARVRGRAAAACTLAALFALSLACSKSTEPHPHLAGRVQLASGASGDLSGTQVQLFVMNPFTAGATPSRVVAAVGSGADVGFDFGEVEHGDFYLVAWKDEGDGTIGPGDLRAWYDGAVDGGGQPVAAVLRVLHGQDLAITLRAHNLTGPGAVPR